MKTNSSLVLLAALGALAFSVDAAAVDTSQWTCETCPFPKGGSALVDVGIGAVTDDSAKFGDFTGLQKKGGHLILGGKATQRGANGYYADLTAADLGLDSRSLAATSGHEGRYAIRLGYSQIPRHLADDAFTPFLGSGGTLLTLPAGYPAGSSAAMPAGSFQPVELGSTRKRYELGGSLISGTHWTWRVALRRDARDGTRPGAASFFASAAQFAVPVDQVTDQVDVSAHYTSRRLQATLGYHLSQFRNDAASLTWSNPFVPVVPGATRGQLALAPDNQFHQVSGSAGYEVSPMIRASADFAVGRMTQNEPYLASTLNTSLTGVGVLPAASLDGKVDTFNGSLRVVATPWPELRVAANYLRDVRDNRTPVASYVQVATDLFVAALPRNNTPFSLTQDRFKLDASYRGPGSWRFAAGAEYDNRNRSYHEVVDSRETTVWGRVGVRPMDTLSLAMKLTHSERSHSAYGTATWFGAPENPLMRKFNLAERRRDRAQLRADAQIGEKVSLGVTVDATQDDYNESLVGLTEARSANVGADVAVALSEQTQLTAFAQAERIRSLQAGSQLGGGPDWNARVKDRFEVVGLGVKHAAIADKLDLGADLTWSRSRSDMTVETFVSEPAFPSARTSMDSLRLYAIYKLDEKTTLTGSVQYEDYRSDDWHLDGVLPATVSNLLAFGQQAPHYRVGVLRFAVRYRF